MKKSGAKCPSGAMHFVCSDAIAAGATRYLACNETSFDFQDSGAGEAGSVQGYLVTVAGTLKNAVFYANAVAGAGETFTYTVRVNGADTALTGTIGGAADQIANSQENVAVNVGDRVTIRVVNSAGGAATQHVCFVGYQR